MSITQAVRLQVRQRAHFACEFCGVTETDTGGELTVEHFHPQTKGGADDLDNLLYSGTHGKRLLLRTCLFLRTGRFIHLRQLAPLQ